ncbi:MAG: glycosyltransferase family 2 protein [Clostridia bacterium]|nr:glycosyltransferase family 2 protein [Clostridia bacterium]
MNTVVIPAKNEEKGIRQTLSNCQFLPVDAIIVVLNGCTDSTKEIITTSPFIEKLHLLEFSQPLGIDVPRAVGAAYAYKLGSDTILFLDGDMQGDISRQLNELISGIKKENLDMALTDCYPNIHPSSPLAIQVLSFREKLNRRLHLFSQLRTATPSHGPHALSRRLLEQVPWKALAVPPLSLAMAATLNLNIKVTTAIPHDFLLSPLRNDEHSTLIAETIIGDCLEALSYLEGLPLSRRHGDVTYLGYHPQRRFDLLEEFLQGLRLA